MALPLACLLVWPHARRVTAGARRLTRPCTRVPPATPTYRDQFEEDPLASAGFVDVAPSVRLEIAYTLCEWRLLEDPELRDLTKAATEGEAEDMRPTERRQAQLLRPEPIGEDSGGRLYYW